MRPDFPVEPGLWHGTERNTRDQERKRRLLDAALELYGTQGYRATTVHAVCQSARVSTRSFYELYADQGELLTRLYHDLNNEVLDAIAARTVLPAADALSAVKALVAAALGPMLEDERKARVLQVEVVGVSQALARERRLTTRRMAAAVDAAFDDIAAAGLIEAAPKGLTSLILIGGITEALVQRVETKPSQRESKAEFIEQVAQVIVRMTGTGTPR